MSATVEQSSTRQAATAATGGLPSASLPESLGILLAGVLPALVRGLFSPRRGAMRLLARLDADARTVSRLRAIRAKRGGEGVRLLGGRIVVLWGASAIKEVLDHSAVEYTGGSGAKAKGMSHFQPDALTLSQGDEWRDRRRFTEAVLASGERVHPFGGRFEAVVADEVARLEPGETLTWSDWEGLFDHITLRVIFGDRARGRQRITELLEQLMGEANRLVGLSRGDAYYELYAELERELRDPEPESLVALFDSAPHSDRTRVVQQLPHWIFAMRDTLAMNAFRALAVIVRDGYGEAELEGCLQEAMRLWPTTPLLARETTEEVTLCGERLEPGTQVMLLNVFNHRRDRTDERVDPGRWSGSERDYRFNHLSNGTQDCPGGPLVLLLGKAVLAGVLSRWELTLLEEDLFNFYEIRFSARPR